MGFLLKKIIGFWLMPLSVAVALMLIGLLLLWFSKRQTTGKVFVSVGLLWLVLVSWNPVATSLLRPIEQQHAEFKLDQPVDYIVVLGNSVTSDPDVPLTSHLSSSARGRLLEGIRVLMANPQATMITTGYGGKNAISSAEVYKQVAISMGIDEQRIIAISEPKDTIEEAQAVKTMMPEGSVLALVTSASHMPRALGLFQKQGLNPIPAPAFYLAKWSEETNWRFDASSLLKSERAIYEMIGTVWAKMTGKI